MRLLQQVVVPLSLTANDDALLRYAGFVARLGVTREFHFLHVLDQPGLRPDDRRCVLAIDRIAQKIDQGFRESSDNLQITCEVRGGNPATTILDFAHDRGAQTILMGAGQGDYRKTAGNLARNGEFSVWFVPESFTGGITRILAPVDFSERTCESLSVAALVGRLSGLEECLAYPIKPGLHPAAQDGGVELRQFLAGVNSHGLGIVPVSVGTQPFGGAVVQCARRQSADLVVLGRSRCSDGSDEEISSLLMDSTVPFLIVRPGFAPAVLPHRLRTQERQGVETDSEVSSSPL